MANTIPSSAPPAGAAPTATERLFQPAELGPYPLPHRMAMAPLTRSRARQPGNIPTALNACYYAQRASAAFIVSEATQVSQQGQGSGTAFHRAKRLLHDGHAPIVAAGLI